MQGTVRWKESLLICLRDKKVDSLCGGGDICSGSSGMGMCGRFGVERERGDYKGQACSATAGMKAGRAGGRTPVCITRTYTDMWLPGVGVGDSGRAQPRGRGLWHVMDGTC